jgi:hypothetical protein
MNEVQCHTCGEDVDARRVEILREDGKPLICLFCGEEQSREERKHWTVLTPHKQGAMFFTKESAREMAKGINNKGGLVR